MSKQVYISADYSSDSGDTEVVDVLVKWGKDNKHKVNFIDMSQVASGSVSKDPDCRPCDLKREFNAQIYASSAVIFIVGDKTSTRTAGSSCSRVTSDWLNCRCTPYKQNSNGTKTCKYDITSKNTSNDVGIINSYSYLKHEFEEAKKRKKPIIIIYNSLRKESSWLPPYMDGYESEALPFWIKDANGKKIGTYEYIKKALGYE